MPCCCSRWTRSWSCCWVTARSYLSSWCACGCLVVSCWINASLSRLSRRALPSWPCFVPARDATYHSVTAADVRFATSVARAVPDPGPGIAQLLPHRIDVRMLPPAAHTVQASCISALLRPPRTMSTSRYFRTVSGKAVSPADGFTRPPSHSGWPPKRPPD